MADNFLNYTGLQYYHNRAETIFASADDLSDLSDRVEEIISEGGEPNVINTVKVNNTALVPDANKAVNIDLSGYAETSDIPTDLSDLTNTGQDPYATEGYVDQNGGKIDVIKVNGTAQTITNKEVDITVPVSSSDLSDASTIAHTSDIPTAVSDLTNDSGFQTANDVSGAITTALANSGDAYQTESDVDDKIAEALTSAMTYKGSVATYADLPASGNKVGDFYNVLADGKNYAWDGSTWDDAGGTIDTSTLWAKTELTAITTAQIDALFA